MIRQWLRHPLHRGRLAAALIALVALSIALPFALGADARHLSAYADGAEDLSDFRARLPAASSAILSTPASLHDVEDASKAVYVAIGPERRYDDAEARAILTFLEAGGNVLIADEGGYGNRIAAAAGFAFDTDRVLDSEGYRGRTTLPVATAHVDTSDPGYRVVFNLPSKITPLSNAKLHDVLAWSSSALALNGSFLDKNDNREIEQGDEPGPHRLIVRTSIGQGTLLLVADTGLFMNEQLRIPDSSYQNADYTAKLLEALALGDRTIYLDESRHAQPPLVAAWNDALRTLGRLTTGIMAPLLIVGLVVLTYLAWYYTRETEDWSHHGFDLGQDVSTPADIQPDVDRLQRLARRRISERYNIPLEQVAAMPTEELQSLTGDRTLAEAAAGTLRSDPTPLFAAYAPHPVNPSPEAPR